MSTLHNTRNESRRKNSVRWKNLSLRDQVPKYDAVVDPHCPLTSKIQFKRHWKKISKCMEAKERKSTKPTKSEHRTMQQSLAAVYSVEHKTDISLQEVKEDTPWLLVPKAPSNPAASSITEYCSHPLRELYLHWDDAEVRHFNQAASLGFLLPEVVAPEDEISERKQLLQSEILRWEQEETDIIRFRQKKSQEMLNRRMQRSPEKPLICSSSQKPRPSTAPTKRGLPMLPT